MSRKVALKIEGMSCNGCVVAVRNVLGRQAGVAGVEVEVGRATLDLEDGVASEDAIKAAIARAGFQVVALQPA